MSSLKSFGFAVWLPVLVVVCLAGLACQRTQPVPAVVQGASMAPNWLGEHQLLICQDCLFPIRYQLDVQDVLTKRIVCPNCGYPDNLISDSTTQPAQSATIDRDQPVSRWDVVAARLPESQALGIKRVIGLPNEKIEVRNGDLYADDKLLIKPWEIQKRVRILVFDSNFQPRLSTVRDRWSPQESNSGWQKVHGRWKFTKDSKTVRPIPGQKLARWNWLDYHHWRCCLHIGQRDDLFPLEDIDSFNPSSPKSLNAMTDACFEIRFRASSDADLGWRFYRGSKWFEFRLNVADNRLSLQRTEPESGLQIAEETERSPTEIRLPREIIDPMKPILIEVSTFDGQLLVFINGHPAVTRVLSDEVGLPESKPGSNLFAIGGNQGAFEIEQVRIWRDIFYLPVKASLFKVPADSFLLLGDNVPVSVDSRHWAAAGILRKNILGIVKPVANR